MTHSLPRAPNTANQRFGCRHVPNQKSKTRRSLHSMNALKLCSIQLLLMAWAMSSVAQPTNDPALAGTSSPGLAYDPGSPWQITPQDWSSTEWRQTVLATNGATGMLELQTNR